MAMSLAFEKKYRNGDWCVFTALTVLQSNYLIIEQKREILIVIYYYKAVYWSVCVILAIT
jgi:hypothetical protein